MQTLVIIILCLNLVALIGFVVNEEKKEAKQVAEYTFNQLEK